MVFLRVYIYVFPFGECHRYGLSDLDIRLYRMDEERCALHNEPGSTCGRKINFAPILPLSLAEDRKRPRIRKYQDDTYGVGDGRYTAILE